LIDDCENIPRWQPALYQMVLYPHDRPAGLEEANGLGPNDRAGSPLGNRIGLMLRNPYLHKACDDLIGRNPGSQKF
jgi:hypothetical protein